MSIRDLLDSNRKKSEAKARKETAKKVAIGVAAGTAVGVAAGILLAPKPGKDTRAQIAEGAKKAADTVKEKVKKTVEKKESDKTPEAE
jgi:gas vesicle protein